jgi:hypothetical protein
MVPQNLRRDVFIHKEAKTFLVPPIAGVSPSNKFLLLRELKFAYGGTETPSFSSRFADWQRLNSIVPES